MSGSIPISQLPAASAVNTTDLLVLVEIGTPNVTKQAPVEALLSGNLPASFGVTDVSSLVASGAVSGGALSGRSGDVTGPLTGTTFTGTELTMGGDITLAADGGGGLRFSSATDTAHVFDLTNDWTGGVFFGVPPVVGGTGITWYPVGQMTQIVATHSSQIQGYDYNGHGGGIGSISGNGSGGVTYATTSDYRAKDIIGPGDGSVIDQLVVYHGTMKGHAASARDMFIAHEVQAHLPHAVTGAKDDVDEKGDPIYQGIDPGPIVAPLVAYAQALKGQVAQLSALVSTMRNQIAAHNAEIELLRAKVGV